METSIGFRIQSLLDRKEGKVSGPMSPMEFAKEMARQGEQKFNRVARVLFDDEEILQRKEDGGYTGFDHLILATQYSNDLWLSLWVDIGTAGVPVAMCYESDRDIQITPIYCRAEFARKLTEEEIRQVFEYIFQDPSVLAIREM